MGQNGQGGKAHDTAERRVFKILPHVEEPFEFDGHGSPFVPMLAGAVAGAVEHLCMYPVDTVKTRMQAVQPGQPHYTGVVKAFGSIISAEGVPRLYRGVSAIVLAALPSHAIYFGTYEFWKGYLSGGKKHGNNHGVHAVSGAFAQMAHDAVVTPVDVVKQRLQLYGAQQKTVTGVVRAILQNEGFRAFYASYPTTLVMNVPFISAHFVTYEFLKESLTPIFGYEIEPDGDIVTKPIVHLLSGAGAGALGGLVSNPFDVMKTRIQTQALPVKMRSLVGAFKHIMKYDGVRGFAQGLTARMLYFTPSAAICWTTYEAMKKLLRLDGHRH